MQTFGRMRLDVDNCVRELVEFGVVRKIAGDPPKLPGRAARARSRGPAARQLPRTDRAHVGIEDTSPSVQRFREMIGKDEKMLAIFEWIRTSAKSDISVLILGPTGSGKELVARMIHELSRRGTERFQAVNCAALPDTLFESEIFGYEKGAFTGAHDRKPGRLELANGGTLFLDEIGDLSLVAQAKLLRVLEERRFERLGGNKSIHGRLPADLRHQPAARSVRPREPLPRGPLLPHQRVLDPAAVAAGARGRHSGAGQSLPRALLRLQRPAARRQAVLAAKRWTCWAPITGPATFASSKARCRAPRCRRRAASSATADIEFLHGRATRPEEESEQRAAVAARCRARAHHPRARGGAVEQARGGRVLDISRGTLYRKIEEYGLEPAGATRGSAAPSRHSRSQTLLLTSRSSSAGTSQLVAIQ